MANVLFIRFSQGAAANGAVPRDLGCRRVPGVVLVSVQYRETLAMAARELPWLPLRSITGERQTPLPAPPSALGSSATATE